MPVKLMNSAMMPQAAFIVYRDLLIWPTTDDDGHCAEIIGVEGEDLRDAAAAQVFATREGAVSEAMKWIDRYFARQS